MRSFRRDDDGGEEREEVRDALYICYAERDISYLLRRRSTTLYTVPVEREGYSHTMSAF